MANCGCPGAGAMRLVSSPAISRHDASSRSVSSPGSTTAPCGSRAMVAISSAVAGIEPVEPAAITGAVGLARKPRRFGLDQRVAALGRLDATALCQNLRPRRRARSAGIPASAANIRRTCPAPDRRAAPTARRASSCRRSAARDRRPARRRPPASARPAACRSAPCSSGEVAHLVTSCVSSSRRSSPPSAWRQRQRFRGDAAGRGFGESDLVLVDVADGDDARQDRGVAFEHIEESIARQPAGAPRRQIERRRGERERIAAQRQSRACRSSTPRSASAETAPTPEW